MHIAAAATKKVRFIYTGPLKVYILGYMYIILYIYTQLCIILSNGYGSID